MWKRLPQALHTGRRSTSSATPLTLPWSTFRLETACISRYSINKQLKMPHRTSIHTVTEALEPMTQGFEFPGFKNYLRAPPPRTL